jgi:hypothetical protein
VKHLLRSPDADGSGGGGGGDTDPKAKPAEVTFSTEQSAKLGEIVSRERDQGKRTGAKEATAALLAELGVASVDDLRAKLKSPTPKAGEAPQGGDDKLAEAIARRDAEWKPKLDAAASELAKANEALANTVNQYRTKEKAAALVDAAAKAKAVDPGVVAKLCADSVGHDDAGNLVVLSADGTPKLNAKGNPMSPQEFVSTFIAENPFLAAPSGTSGGGSGPNAGKPGAQDLAAQIAAANQRGDLVTAVALERQRAEQAATSG